MGIYKLSQVRNRLDIRLIDLFVRQNKSNEWLTIADCAAWVFQTNDPSAYHKKYTQNKLTSMIGNLGTAINATTVFDTKYVPTEQSGYVYRLKDSSSIKAGPRVSLATQIDKAYCEVSSMSCQDVEY